MQLLESNWPLLALALGIGLALAWWLLAGRRRAKVERLGDADATIGARRNQALIDAPPAASMAIGGEAPSLAPPPLAATPEPVAAPAAPPAAAPEAAPVAEAPAPSSSPEPELEPAAPPAPQPAVTQDSDLARIKGVGPKLVAQLQALGVTTLAQIAQWDDADIARIDSQLGRFAGRIVRDDWVGQARLLNAGDLAAYEARFGKV